jgi:ankyrin repeat protein
MGIDEEIAQMSEEEQFDLLIQASTLGRTDAIHKVIQANNDLRFRVDKDGASALHFAVHNAQVDAVR